MNGRRNHFIYANPCQALSAAAVSGELCPSGLTWKILLSAEMLSLPDQQPLSVQGLQPLAQSGIQGESSTAEAEPSAGFVECSSALRFPGFRSPWKVEFNGSRGLFLHRGAAALPVSTQAWHRLPGQSHPCRLWGQCSRSSAGSCCSLMGSGDKPGKHREHPELWGQETPTPQRESPGTEQNPEHSWTCQACCPPRAVSGFSQLYLQVWV